LGKDKIWVVKHDQWEETSSNLPSLAVQKKRLKYMKRKFSQEHLEKVIWC
jgi:hypothetical protein